MRLDWIICHCRATGTLSGGELLCIVLQPCIGSVLRNCLYSGQIIGLQSNDKLLGALMNLRDLGNTLIVVEHDEIR